MTTEQHAPDHPHHFTPLGAKVRVRLKRILPPLVLAALAYVIGGDLGGLDQPGTATVSVFGWQFSAPGGWVVLGVIVLAVVFAGAGIIGARAVGNELARVSEVKAGPSAGAAVRLVVIIGGYAIVLLSTLTLLGVSARNLLVGGAVTGVVIGIAAQQTLGNFFAGIVLFFARPYVPGQRVKIRSGALGGPFEGVIVRAGMMYTLIETDDEGPVNLPNAALLGSAIGPAPEKKPDEETATPTPTDLTAPDLTKHP
ncbi:mechanosensitive ion channel [Nakamurella sp. YIM 132087]|uniref:Mechanosensitive ion channel n=1 Tax=Nakamurella alba TaxID=2665158 RepID=A0A7K1FS10_9ACTN|nr:mechanosensitive ion channel family protein [Nakamurella alba]MTD16928.1 mechanosensitive ion channel [Nakamurella alba]